MDATPESHDRFEVRTTSDSHFGWIRTRLGLERTLLAWARTSVSLIGFGFTIVQFFERLQDMKGVAPAERPFAPRYLGLALIAAGVITMLISIQQYRGMVRYLWSGPFKVLAGAEHPQMRPVLTQTPSFATALVLVLIGTFAFFAVLFRAI